MATTLRNDAKDQLMKTLREQGYATYALLVSYFDIYLTDDPKVIGYMVPGKAKIVLNGHLNISQVSTIVRHEILHEYFTHGARMQAFNEKNPKLMPKYGNVSEIANIAADYEISNRGYTDADKATARAIIMGDKVLRGLVTEDKYPDWQTKSFEEMYTELLKQQQHDEESLKPLIDQLSEISQRDIDDMGDAIEDIMHGQSSGSTGSGNEDGGDKETSDASRSAGSAEDNGADGSDTAADKSSEGDTSDDKQSGSEDLSNSDKELLDKAKNALDKASDEYKGTNAGHSSPEKGKPLDSPEDQARKVDVAARVEQIKEALANADLLDNILAEVNAQKRKDKIRREAAKARVDYARNGNGGLRDFKLDLQRFVARECRDPEKEDSWETFNPSYEDSEFIMPGKWDDEKPNVPKINVYWDTSGSFSDPKKTAAARAAIDSIKSYERKGLITIDVYYHSSDVYTSPHGGGNKGDKVMEHIQDTHPDNVIIITDGDLSDTSIPTSVPGAVWMLFYDYTSSGLIKNLRGRKQSKWYMIQYK